MGFPYQLGVIGAGNMAEGLVAAALRAHLYGPAEVVVSDPLPERRELFVRAFGVAVTTDNRALAGDSHRVLLAIKPQSLQEVLGGIADLLGPEHLLISILAGVGTARIEAACPGGPVRVVRVMPNLAVRVGAGMAAICAGRHATAADLADVRALMDAGGRSLVLTDEGLIDAVTAVSGSGPAYFYYFVEAITAGGVACGLSQADALMLAEQTCLGAARMMLETGAPPAELRRKVTSRGGTTQAAIEHLERAGVPAAIREAVRAAFDRARELGK